jgi:hypothetical protein
MSGPSCSDAGSWLQAVAERVAKFNAEGGSESEWNSERMRQAVRGLPPIRGVFATMDLWKNVHCLYMPQGHNHRDCAEAFQSVFREWGDGGEIDCQDAGRGVMLYRLTFRDVPHWARQI